MGSGYFHLHNSGEKQLPMKSQYFQQIDGLRAIAVLSVMLFHLNEEFLPGGFTGVDVFFVISGYVVSKAAAEHTPESFWKFLGGFYARRAVRIIPALFICLAVTSALTAIFIPHSWLSGTIEKTGLWAYFGFSNYALVLLNDGYFSPRTDFNPFVHTWSLGVEEQFYLIFPFAFYIWIKSRSGTQVTRRIGSLIFPTLAITSLIISWHQSANNPTDAYYLIPSRFWELAAGVVTYQAHASNWVRRNSQAVPIIGLFLLALGFWFSKPDAFPIPWALLPTIGTVMLIHSIVIPMPQTAPLPWSTVIHKSLQCRTAIWIGKLSYSLYLWHWPVYVLMRWTTGLDSAFQMALAVTATFLLSIASFFLIESPSRQSDRLRSTKHIFKISSGALILAAGYFTSSHLYLNRSTISLSVTKNTAEWYPYPTPIQPDASTPKPLQNYSIYVIGNSHTGAYEKMLREAEQRLGLRVELHQIGGCTIGHFLLPIGRDLDCQKTGQRLMKHIERTAKSGDVVFFASLRTHRLGDQWARFDVDAVLKHSQSPQNADNIRQALADNMPMLEALKSQGIKVLIDAPKPVFLGPPFRCSDWFNRQNPICGEGLAVDRNMLLTMREPVMESLRTLSAQLDNVYLWDPFPAFCPPSEEVCSPYDNEGRPLFFDGDHMSGHGNDHLYPHFAERITTILMNNTQSKLH